jgi:hypothetical protein
MGDELTFEAWAEKAELTPETIKLVGLNNNGFISLKSCKLMNAVIIKKNFAKSLSLAQSLLLQQATEFLTKISQPQHIPAQPQDNQPTGTSNVVMSGASGSCGLTKSSELSVTSLLQNRSNYKNAYSTE